MLTTSPTLTKLCGAKSFQAACAASTSFLTTLLSPISNQNYEQLGVRAGGTQPRPDNTV